MICCTFFGHKDTPPAVADKLRLSLIDLIENKNVDTFYVGNQGNFDRIVYQTLRHLKTQYPHIHYAVVLAYLPVKQTDCCFDYETDTLFPDELERTHPKYAISKRNHWLVEHSSYALTYVIAAGGAKQYKELAERKGLVVINLAESFASFRNTFAVANIKKM